MEGHIRRGPDPRRKARRRGVEALFVGLRVGEHCMPSLAMLHDQRIRVLHASASLGTAVYERSGEHWNAVQEFAWRCRDGQTSDQDRARFLEEEGWFATTCGVGTRGEVEFRIEKDTGGGWADHAFPFR